MTLIRPSDANEVAVAWRVAIEHKTGPVGLALTRQKLPVLDRSKYASPEGLTQGAYILAESGSPQIILIGTGSEVQHVVAAYEQLVKEGVSARVVAMPSWELFERQPKEYRDKVFPAAVKKRLAVEAGVPQGWHKYVGDAGEVFGMTTFGHSAPVDAVMKGYGFTAENVLKLAKELLIK
jgi:transketolase